MILVTEIRMLEGWYNFFYYAVQVVTVKLKTYNLHDGNPTYRHIRMRNLDAYEDQASERGRFNALFECRLLRKIWTC